VTSGATLFATNCASCHGQSATGGEAPTLNSKEFLSQTSDAQASVTVRVICDRGVTHEIVRHRIASYSQESTRYCNYADDKFSNQISCIEPFFWTGADEASRRKYQIWKETMELIEKKYNELLELGATPQEARSILPNSLKTEMVMTMNLREWRHFFRIRTNKSSHPQMRELAIPMLREFQKRIPIIFDDIAVDNWNEN
jgi:thymidylate synthase (FAD)